MSRRFDRRPAGGEDAAAGSPCPDRRAGQPKTRWLTFVAALAIALVLPPAPAHAQAQAQVPVQSDALPVSGAGPPTAIFLRPSYAPGETARLRITTTARKIVVQPLTSLPAAASKGPWSPFTSVRGDTRVGQARTFRWRPGTGTVSVPVSDWPSGVYFVRVQSSAGTAVAPLIVRPRHLGTAHVLIVIPTYSWEAYNGRNGDTWYDCSCVHTVDLSRPYLYGGVPYNFGQYDRGLLAWLVTNDAHVDVISDQDYDGVANGRDLRSRYRMIVFAGHAEYATAHMFAITEQYRNLGGHLLFLSANDFFRQVAVRGSAMTLIGRFRDRGHPEAALMGAQYLDWNRNIYPNRPYTVTGARAVPWLFAGTGLRDGDHIQGNYGIEIDGTSPASPPNTQVIARIPRIFGALTAEMTYYTTARGAEVFDAGTIDFGGNAFLPQVGQMLGNLWRHMTGAAVTSAAACPPPVRTARSAADRAR